MLFYQSDGRICANYRVYETAPANIPEMTRYTCSWLFSTTERVFFQQQKMATRAKIPSKLLLIVWAHLENENNTKLLVHGRATGRQSSHVEKNSVWCKKRCLPFAC